MNILELDPIKLKENKLDILKSLVSSELSKDNKDVLIHSEFLDQVKIDEILAERQAIYSVYEIKKAELEDLSTITDVLNFSVNIYES